MSYIKMVPIRTLISETSMPLPIAPSEYDTDDIQVKKEQDAQPITDKNDIDRMVRYLLAKKRWRDAMLLVFGINTGLRYSDLVRIRFKNIIDDDGFFREELILIEQKTSNTKGKKKGSDKANPINRHIYLNEAVRKIVRIYLEHKEASMDDLLFYNESHNYKNIGKGMSPTCINSIFKKLTAELGIEGRHSTHFLRKTFSYHFLSTPAIESRIDSRRLQWLQYTLHHSDMMTTLRYAGFLDGEIKNLYSSLNLGLSAIDEFVETESKEREVMQDWA